VDNTGSGSGNEAEGGRTTPGTHGGIAEVVWHVPVEVTVRLARTRMPLGDVLALRRGEVLTFEHPVGAPVELVAAGRVVASGELVSVEGKFGLRVLDIAPEPAGEEVEP
jgi:flagellar motor switch protein FliN/FliY